MPNLRFLCAIGLVVLSMVTLIESCGVSTHIEIAYRAADSLPQNDLKTIISNNLDAFQAGAPYPDSFYSSLCFNGAYGDVSEDTHWTPFIRTSVDYIRQTYPQPYSAQAQKLIAFIHGVASHQVADAVWHASLTGVPNGLIDAEAWVDFGGNRGNAHSLVDPGGDVIANFELDLSYIALVTEWYIPLQDLLNIYNLYQKQTGSNVHNISEAVILECSSLMFLARLGERIAMALDYKNQLSNSTFFQEQYYNYYLGGVSNMHAVTQMYWDRIAVALQSGNQNCLDVHNPVDYRCNGSDVAFDKDVSAEAKKKRFFRELPDSILASKDDLQITRLANGGATISMKKKDNKHVKKISQAKALPAPHTNKTKGVKFVSPTNTWSSNNNYAQAAQSIVFMDANADGYIDAIVGVPQYNPTGCANQGAVFIFFNRNGTLNPDPILETSADIVIFPDQTQYPGGQNLCGSRFGFAVAAVDYNNDGIDDLVVGSPSFGIWNNSYVGAVAVYYAPKYPARQFPLSPSKVFVGTTNKRNLGWRLATMDVDGDNRTDLVIGSPFDPASSNTQHGSVAVYLAKDFPSSTPSYTLRGERTASWFGYDIALAVVKGKRFLLIGAPYYSVDEKNSQGHGRVYAYVGSNISFILQGDMPHDRLGYSFRIGSFYGKNEINLAVSAVTASNRPTESVQFTGRVYILRGSVWDSTGVVSVGSLLHDSIDGVDIFQRLGYVVRAGDLNGDGVDDLVVSAPLSYRSWNNLGQVYVFYGGLAFLAQYYGSSCDPITPCIDSGADLIISSNLPNDRFGWGMELSDIGLDRKQDLFVFAQMSSDRAKVGGTIYFYKS